MKTFITSLLLLSSFVLSAQTIFQREKRDYTWRVGIRALTDLIEPPFIIDDSKLTFIDGSVYLSYVLTTTWLWENNTMMCDTAGKLLFYTNGLWVTDSAEQIMPHGDTITSNYHTDYDYEDIMIQGTLALPDPGNQNRYYLLHSRWGYFDSLPGSSLISVGRWVYYSVIDMTEHGGLGDVIEKRTLLLEDTMSGFTPRLKACRHANGRDWWIPIGLYGNKYNMYLLDPNGFHLVNEQTFDYNEYYGNGQAVFSADGSKYARMTLDSATLQPMIRLFDFDRCTGQLTQNKFIVLPYSDPNTEGYHIGLSFSPSGRFLYLNNFLSLYQIDLWDAAPIAELIVYLEPNEEEKTFFLSTLGPADKIYIAPLSDEVLHIINYPDLKGDSCGVCSDCIYIPLLIYGVPNFAEYRTGPLDGSSCDSLGINMPGVVSVSPSPFKLKEVSVSPNPAVDVLRVLVADEVVGLLQFELYDGMGRRVLEQKIAKGYNAVYIDNLPTGLYFWVAKDANGRTVRSGKVIKQ